MTPLYKDEKQGGLASSVTPTALQHQVDKLSVLKYPVESLLQKSDPVDFYEALGIIKLLRRACEQQTWGDVLGMAAPQIGINKRVFLALGEAYINPEYIKRSKHSKTYLEGCYSMAVNKFDYPVKRRDNIRLRWLDEDGNDRKQYFSGVESQVIQHELDHLDGKLVGNDLRLDDPETKVMS